MGRFSGLDPPLRDRALGRGLSVVGSRLWFQWADAGGTERDRSSSPTYLIASFFRLSPSTALQIVICWWLLLAVAHGGQ
jgi:hypothetical protein